MRRLLLIQMKFSSGCKILWEPPSQYLKSGRNLVIPDLKATAIGIRLRTRTRELAESSQEAIEGLAPALDKAIEASC